MGEEDPLRAELENFTSQRRWYKVTVTFIFDSQVLLTHLKVRWTQVPHLVEKRRVVLKDGWAYVPEKEQSSIIFQEFERRLEKALEVCLSLA